MSIFRDPTVSMAAVVTGVLLVLCALGLVLGDAPPVSVATAEQLSADQEVRVWRAQLRQLAQLGVAGDDDRLVLLADQLTTQAAAQADLHDDSVLGQAWQQAADAAGALAEIAEAPGPTARTDAAVDRVLAAGDSLAGAAFDGLLRPIGEGTSLEAGTPQLRRATPVLDTELDPRPPVLVAPRPGPMGRPTLGPDAPSAAAPRPAVPSAPLLAP